MTFQTQIKEFKDMVQDQAPLPDEWMLQSLINEENLSYLVWNQKTKEALIVDPTREDEAAWVRVLQARQELRVLAVIDTHTHADHVSLGPWLSEKSKAPYVMHHLSMNSRVHLRISRDAQIPTLAGPIRFIETPGHTADGMTVLWGPFVFTGDTILYGDTGRDDLPGGDPAAHFHSLKKIESAVTPQSLVLPGHDHRGGRITSWKTQLEVNPSLTQKAEDFIREAGSFAAPAPKAFKESLFENCK